MKRPSWIFFIPLSLSIDDLTNSPTYRNVLLSGTAEYKGGDIINVQGLLPARATLYTQCLWHTCKIPIRPHVFGYN